MIIVLATSRGEARRDVRLDYWLQCEQHFGPNSFGIRFKWKPGPGCNVKPVLISSFRQSSETQRSTASLFDHIFITLYFSLVAGQSRASFAL